MTELKKQVRILKLVLVKIGGLSILESIWTPRLIKLTESQLCKCERNNYLQTLKRWSHHLLDLAVSGGNSLHRRKGSYMWLIIIIISLNPRPVKFPFCLHINNSNKTKKSKLSFIQIFKTRFFQIRFFFFFQMFKYGIKKLDNFSKI